MNKVCARVGSTEFEKALDVKLKLLSPDHRNEIEIN